MPIVRQERRGGGRQKALNGFILRGVLVVAHHCPAKAEEVHHNGIEILSDAIHLRARRPSANEYLVI